MLSLNRYSIATRSGAVRIFNTLSARRLFGRFVRTLEVPRTKKERAAVEVLVALRGGLAGLVLLAYVRLREAWPSTTAAQQRALAISGVTEAHLQTPL